MCDSPRTGCARRITPIYMWREQAIIQWSRHVISIVVCRHSVKLCALSARSFRSQQLHSQFCARSLFPLLLVFHHKHAQSRLFEVVPSSRLKAWSKKQHKIFQVFSSLIFTSSALLLYVVLRKYNWLLSDALATASTKKFLTNPHPMQLSFLTCLSSFSQFVVKKKVFL